MNKLKIFAVALTGILTISAPTAVFADISMDQASHRSEDGSYIETTDNPLDTSKLISDNWNEGSYFSTVEINTDSGTVEKDGEDSSLQDALGVSASTEQSLSDDSAKEVSDYLESKDIYDVDSEGSTVTVTAPYQMMRILVLTDDAKIDTCNASSALYDTGLGGYVLQYGTEEATKTAYDKFVKAYGAGNVVLDQLAQLSDTDTETGTAGSALASASDTGTVVPVQAASIQSLSAVALSADYTSWGTHWMGLDSLRDYANSNSATYDDTVTVAVIDTGIDTSNAMFSGRTISSYSKSLLGSSYEDDNGHGSHVSGIIADGTSDQVQFLVIKALDSNGEGTEFDILDAVRYAAQKGADVINISAGFALDLTSFTDQADYNYMEAYMEYAYDAGVTICAAAGNDAKSSLYYPASSAYVLSVAAMNSKYTKASFSNYGSGLDFIAPGTNIRSAYLKNTTAVLSGTSMASPHLTAAAMIKVFHPSYTVSQVKSALKASTVDLGVAGRDKKYGYGYVNLYSYGSYNASAQSLQSLTSSASSYRKTYGADSFSLGAKASGGGAVVYTTTSSSIAAVNSSGAVSVQGVGTATIKLTAVATSSAKQVSKSVKITVLPKKAYIKDLVAGSKKVTVKWSKKTPSTGYQIRYSKSKSMSNAKTVRVKGSSTVKKTISSLSSKKTYYFQVRTYKTVSGKNYYSGWSAIKKVRVK